MKIVVDTNCLIASISPKSPFFFLYQAFRSQQFDWAASTEILLEYEEQIALYYNQNTADRVLQILLASKNTLLAEPSFPLYANIGRKFGYMYRYFLYSPTK